MYCAQDTVHINLYNKEAKTTSECSLLAKREPGLMLTDMYSGTRLIKSFRFEGRGRLLERVLT